MLELYHGLSPRVVDLSRMACLRQVDYSFLVDWVVQEDIEEKIADILPVFIGNG